jgi:mono/diheme cytochrome c family protein
VRVSGLRVLVGLAIVGAGLFVEPRFPAMSAAADDTGPQAPVRLVDTGLYRDVPGGSVADGVQPFVPQYPLWSDGALKQRWVLLPPGTVIDVSNRSDWEFPVGTRFWKEFVFGGRRVETRFLWKASADRWVFASYRWNADGTDAVRVGAEGAANVAHVARDRRHSIPSVDECRACHGSPRVEPLGFNPLQLSTDRDPNAIHGEPLVAGAVTTATLQRDARLTPAAAALVAAPPRILATSPRTRAVIGYLSTNCGSCHRAGADIVRLGTSLKLSDVLDGDAVVRAMALHLTDWVGAGAAAGPNVLIDHGSPERSAMVRRMRSRRPSSQMPPLGTVVEDRQALDAVVSWIAQDVADTSGW